MVLLEGLVLFGGCSWSSDSLPCVETWESWQSISIWPLLVSRILKFRNSHVKYCDLAPCGSF